MYNRLQRYLHLPNLAPVRRPAPVVKTVPVVKLAATPPPVAFTPARQDVAICAYYMFLNQGSRHGFDLDHWLAAESQLFAEHHAALK